MDYRVFYSELGKLLYAVADADGVVSKEEKKSLYDLVKTRLAHKEVHTDEFGTTNTESIWRQDNYAFFWPTGWRNHTDIPTVRKGRWYNASGSCSSASSGSR